MTAGGDRRGRWAGRLWAALDRPRVWIWLILGYCAAHFVLRLCLSPIYTLDEAEQVLFAQELSLGYRFRHPPLITWATYLTQSVFGVSLPSLAALKYLIMAGGFLALFQAGRLFLDDVRLSGLAVAAFWMTFTVGYYPHVDLMHTVALTSLLGAALWALGRLVCRPAPLWIYALAGAIIAAGTLSKYVFAIFPLAAGLALLFVPELRARLRPSGIALMVAVALALLAPYAIWTAVHEYSLLTLARDVAGSEERPFFLLAWGQGLVGLALALAMFVLPFLAIFASLFPRARAPLPLGGE
ncbi:MAG: glycosyltransferase family 39 protein [Alphaproteobacteria bacterium]|nr:glycosyltransferase family 39 protein [Alphaproteobacteria bacterium]